jgi:hypothetical protein
MQGSQAIARQSSPKREQGTSFFSAYMEKKKFRERLPAYAIHGENRTHD